MEATKRTLTDACFWVRQGLKVSLMTSFHLLQEIGAGEAKSAEYVIFKLCFTGELASRYCHRFLL